MSANNQMLIKKHKGEYYVFEVMAESWSKINPLPIKSALKSFKTLGEAYKFANRYTDDLGFFTEYGVSNRLIKDGANIRLVK